MTFRDDRAAQQHRIDSLEDELAAARAEAERLRDERDAALSPPQAPPQAPPPVGFGVGSAVWVEWNGRWWRGHVVSVLGPSSWQIGYDGWSAYWNEAVGPNRIARRDQKPPGPVAGRPFLVLGVPVVLLVVVIFVGNVIRSVFFEPAVGAPVARVDDVPDYATPFDPSRAPVGSSVLVSWNGSWYSGTILAIEAGGYRIHYDGWSDAYDEVVTPDRLMSP